MLSLSIGCDLRRMWPYPAGCGGELRFSSSPDGRAALIATASGDAAVALVTSRPAALTLTPGSGAAGAPLVRWACSVALDAPFRLAVVGGSGWRDFSRALGELRRLGLAGLVRERQQREAILRAARLGVRASSEEVGRSFEWAKRRLDSFLADTPGVGRSLLAGYAPSTAGWGDGRPGYAWYFGRDACWTAFALLAIGEFAQVRQVLRFLAEHQDVDGKIMHEVTTSGQHHYDAADSTPLFLLLVARYLAWSGDRGEVERLWPHLQRALAFCALTDTDGDGLIENAGVGHGWIESGPLGGEHVSLYLAACWRAALEGLAYAARVSGRDDAARELGERATRARSAIEAGFFDAARGRYALARMPDGSLRATETALSAVPVLLGAVDLARASAFLDRLAAARFSAPWGVRMLPTDDPAFSPTGYHSGAVWPLFTGWSALAEYRAGRSEAAFGHLMANVRLAFTRQLGAFDEVLHGLEERAAGVCPDQAWSAAMVVQPLVDGLLGVVPDAPRGRLALAPQLPANLVWLEAKRLRCGDTTLDLRVARSAGALDVRLRRASGPSLWVTVAAPVEAVPPAVEVDGSEVVPEMAPWGKRLRAAVAFEVHAEHEVRFPR